MPFLSKLTTWISHQIQSPSSSFPDPNASQLQSETAIQETNNLIRHLQTQALRQNPFNRGGEWTCCACHSINTLFKIPGKHPLGYLACTSCPHIWCYCCQTDGMTLHSFSLGEDFKLPDLLPKEVEIPYVGICGECGLTSRAERFQTDSGSMIDLGIRECMCGERRDRKNTWRRIVMEWEFPKSSSATGSEGDETVAKMSAAKTAKAGGYQMFDDVEKFMAALEIGEGPPVPVPVEKEPCPLVEPRPRRTAYAFEEYEDHILKASLRTWKLPDFVGR